MRFGDYTLGIGGVIALLVLAAAFILWLMGLMDPKVAACVMALAIARLVP